MNILYVDHYAGGPDLGMEFRPYYLAREWARRGHDVCIVAASYAHVRASQPDGTGRIPEQVVDGIRYRWLPTPAYRGNGAGRALNIGCFIAGLSRDATEMARRFRPDVVIASSTYPMDFWPVRRIARIAGAATVFEVHDLWPLSPIELSGMAPNHPFARLCRAAESDAYRSADLVVSMLPCVHDYMASRGLDLSRLCIVPNGVSPDEWSAPPSALRADVDAAAAAFRAQGRCVVGYAGSMGLPNALDTFLDAAALLRDAPIGFVLVGDGLERERLVGRLHREALEHVVWLPPVPKREVPALLARFDVAYLGWQRVPIYRFGIAPNKLMDYMMAGRAVLHSVEAGNDPVAESGCGLSVAPGAATEIADGLHALAAMSADERLRLGERGRAFVLAHHTYPVLAERFLDAMQMAAKRRNDGRP